MPLTEPDGVYRPRHPGRTVVYRLFEEHFERYVREYEDRYEAREGSLPKVVSTTVEAYLACGPLEGGFARRCSPSTSSPRSSSRSPAAHE